ncbi:MAG TPA: 3-methyl-2-oxobutanoate hydroxymethyltransferase, partial [Candidatus Aquilonibacter sp.]|nr:3-methyl-2-oxobutanoate hydroxymethyltransferase [Candidatus Aquilonibacter sp.]
TPQSINAMGGFHVQGQSAEAARQVERDARAVEAAGAFAVVLESMPREIAAGITRELRIPTIGIGAGPDCDGQVLVFHDLVGLTEGYTPKFVRRYADLAGEITRAVTEYCEDVRGGKFPADGESYHSAAELRARPVKV